MESITCLKVSKLVLAHGADNQYILWNKQPFLDEYLIQKSYYTTFRFCVYCSCITNDHSDDIPQIKVIQQTIDTIEYTFGFTIW